MARTYNRLGGEKTSIGGMVAAAVEDLENGQRSVWRSVTHYSVEGEASRSSRVWSLTLRHYGTIILAVSQHYSGERTSAIGPYWWGSRTDMSAIAKAHRALGMRRSIKRGQLVSY